MFKSNNKKGQSTVEYVVGAGAVIGVVITLVAAPNSPFRHQMGNTITNAVDNVGVMSQRLGKTYEHKK